MSIAVTSAKLSAARLTNLRSAARLARSNAAFAAATGLSAATVGIYLKPGSTNVLGQQFADKFELQLGLPHGCMDTPGGVEPFHQGIRERFGFGSPHAARYANLLSLDAAFGGEGGRSRLATAIGAEQERLDALILPPAGARPFISDSVSHHIEESFGFPSGSFDAAGAVALLVGRERRGLQFMKRIARSEMVFSVRIERLQHMVNQVGSRHRLSAVTGCSLETMSHLLMSSRVRDGRPHGGRFFRDLEHRLGLPHRCMDASQWPAVFEHAVEKQIASLAASTVAENAADVAAEPNQRTSIPAVEHDASGDGVGQSAPASTEVGLASFQRRFDASDRATPAGSGPVKKARGRRP